MIFVQNIIPTIRPCRNGRGELFSVAASTIDIERLLMLRPQQVEDDFHRRERRDGDVDEHGVPVRHRTVPQPRQLLRPQLAAGIGFRRDETRLRIGIPPQVEFLAPHVAHAADQIDRIEVGGPLHERPVGGCDLARLGDLERFGAVVVDRPEGAAARLALVAYHAAQADGTVEDGAQHGRVVVVGQLHAEPFADEAGDVGQFGAARIERADILETALLQFEQQSCQHLLIGYRVAAAGVGGHVVDVLDEDEVGVDLVEVFDQGAVSRRTEKQFARIGAEERVVGTATVSVEGFCSENEMS